LQYLPNLMAASVPPAASWTERLASFWFDVTKQDWRETMVLGVRGDQALDRLGMWSFDARQQFGAVGIVLAIAGLVALWRHARPWAVLAFASYFCTTAFALTYNIGDTHVFFLPGHFITALCAGAGLTMLDGNRLRRGLALSMIVYAAWRGWSTWPAVDRHQDRRGEQLITRLTFDLNDRNALFVPEMNWQLENVLLYSARYLRNDFAWVRLGDVMQHLPFLVQDNREEGRDLVLTADAARDVIAAYGSAVPMVEDLAAAGLVEAARQVPKGSPYVLTLLTPPRERPLVPGEVADAFSLLTGGHAPPDSGAAYQVVAGIAGESPQVVRTADRPFVDRFALLEEPIVVRMDSWLPIDTFRRAGFGHVLRGRDHVQILERGVNLIWFGRDGSPSAPFYASSLFAAEPRYRIPAATPQLVLVRQLTQR
jgi:hypothetical protein